MAVTAVIDIRVRGQSNLDKLKKQTEKIQTLINGIKPIPSLFDTKTARNQVNAIKEFETELKKVAGSQSKFRGTTASVNRQLGNLQSIFGNLTADTTKWRNALVATERAQLSLFQLEQKAMNQRAKSLGSRGAAKDIIPSVLGAGGSVAQSVEGLAAYRTELTRLRNSVKLGSKEYNELGAAIDKVNKTLSAKEGLAGLRQNLEQVSASQSKLLAINAGYVSQTLQVRKAEQALNAELLTRKKVLDAVIIAEQRQMGGAAGVVKKAGRGGIEGLKAALAEAEGIQSRMLTTEQGYIDQLQIVKKLQEAINQEVATRGRLEKTNIQRLKEAGEALRPGRGIERRGLIAGGVGGLAGLGMASKTAIGGGIMGLGSKTLGFAGTAAGAGAGIGVPGMGLVAKGVADTKVALAGLMTAAKAVAGINVLNPGFIAALGVAWVALGNKGFARAAKDLGVVGAAGVKTTAGLFKLGKEFQNTKETLFGLNQGFKLSSRGAEELGVNVEKLARKQKLAQAQLAKGISTGTVLGGGFGSWSSKMDKQYPTGDARIQMEAANQARRAEMHFMNVIKGANERLVEVKGKQLDIDQRIEQTLKKRGLQIQKNGKYLEKRTNKGMGGMMSGFSGTKAGQAVLGGGFPMLFGGGPGAVAGGALGGLWKGFAGGIGGSIIGGMVDRAVASIGQLGMAMNPLTADIQKLTEAVGLAGTEEGKRIATIEKLVGKEAALEAVRRRMVERIGNDNTQALEDFGKTWQAIVNNFQLQLLKIAALVAKFAEKTGLAKWLANQGAGGSQVITQSQRMQLGASDSELGKEYDTAKFNKRFAGFRLEDAVAAKNEAVIKSGNNPLFGLTEEGKLLNKELKEANREWSLTDSIVKRIESDYVALVELGGVDKLQKQELKTIQDAMQQPLKDEIAHLERSLKIGTKGAEQEKEAKDILADQNKLLTDKISLEETNNLQLVEKRDRLKEQLEMWTQIKDTIAGGLTNAIMGLIDGTKTLAESLAGILKQLAQILINKAFTSWIGGMNFGGGGGGGFSGPPKPILPRGGAEGAYWTNGIKPFAAGGLVTRPTLGLIGEAGEDEYIIPSSKMQGAMERYSAGARGQGVIPGGGTVASGSGVSSSPTVVNYTGPVLSFNSEAYVPKSAIPEIINSAARRGAQEGQSKVMSQLKNSRSQRSRIGL